MFMPLTYILVSTSQANCLRLSCVLVSAALLVQLFQGTGLQSSNPGRYALRDLFNFRFTWT